MENKTESTVTKTFRVEEFIGAISGRIITGINPIENEDNIAYALKRSTTYDYNPDKSLAENICAAFPQFKLKAASDEFSKLMESWKGQDLTFIDTKPNAILIALTRGVPATFEVTYDKNKKPKEKTLPEGPDRTIPKGNIIVLTGAGSDACISDWKHRHIWGD